jgi:exopolysaccharide biosynthesis predicted pyruvyltransferase EpsI
MQAEVHNILWVTCFCLGLGYIRRYMSCFFTSLESSRNSLLKEIGTGPLTFFRSYGNIGDRLISAGTRQLLSQVNYRELDIRDAREYSGEMAIVSGSGGWSKPWHDMPDLLRPVLTNFDKVIVLPSSFDPAEPTVERFVRSTTAFLFSRELESQQRISKYGHNAVAFDCAFYFDYGPYMRHGSGVLYAYRTDREKGLSGLPAKNIDVSVAAADLDHWLHTIAKHREVWTDRAHVMIAAALLRKRVRFCEGSYFKLRALADYALSEFDVVQEFEIPS